MVSLNPISFGFSEEGVEMKNPKIPTIVGISTQAKILANWVEKKETARFRVRGHQLKLHREKGMTWLLKTEQVLPARIE